MEALSRRRDPRSEVISFLRLLSDLDAVDAFAARYADKDVPAELCRIWFDEIYAPSKTYLEGMKGDASEQEAERFNAFFTTEELDALERFHRFFELRVEMHQKSGGQLGKFSDSQLWKYLFKDAIAALDAFENPRLSG